MKNYKFRGKPLGNSRKKGNWVKGYLYIEKEKFYYILNNIKIESNCTGNLNIKGMVQVEPETVGQYTGSKDGKMNEIYEGDILINEKGIKGVVILEPKLSGFFVKVRTQKKNLFIPLNVFLIGSQVIGNIYDNPDLK